MIYLTKFFHFLFGVLCIFTWKIFGSQYCVILFFLSIVFFIIYFVLFLIERNYFEQMIDANELSRLHQLAPLIMPFNIKISSKKWDKLEQDRNKLLQTMNKDRAKKFLLYEEFLSLLSGEAMFGLLFIGNYVLHYMQKGS